MLYSCTHMATEGVKGLRQLLFLGLGDAVFSCSSWRTVSMTGGSPCRGGRRFRLSSSWSSAQFTRRPGCLSRRPGTLYMTANTPGPSLESPSTYCSRCRCFFDYISSLVVRNFDDYVHVRCDQRWGPRGLASTLSTPRGQNFVPWPWPWPRRCADLALASRRSGLAVRR